MVVTQKVVSQYMYYVLSKNVHTRTTLRTQAVEQQRRSEDNINIQATCSLHLVKAVYFLYLALNSKMTSKPKM